MRRTLYLYIFREIPPPFLLGMATFTIVLLMGRLMRLADMVVEKGVPVADVLRMILYLLPSFWQATIPMALLLAILLAFGRLSGDSEIIAMKACGVSLYGILWPALSFGLVAFAAGIYLNLHAVPWGNTSFKRLVVGVIEAKAAVAIKEKVFNDDFPGIVLYTDTFDPVTRKLGGILVQDERNPREPTTIFAREGMITTDPKARTMGLYLANGSIHRRVGDTGYRLVDFRNYDLKISLDQGPRELVKNELDMTLPELLESLSSPRYDARTKLHMRMEIQSRFALPFACFSLTLIGIPLGIRNRRSGKAAGFSTSIGVLILYYIMLSGGKTLGERELLPPMAAIWLPNLVYIALGAYLFRKAATEEQIPLFEFLRNLGARIMTLFPWGRR